MTYSVCAVMIVKDEEKNIKKCIDSFCDYVDKVVVVDTGSSDSTLKLLSDFKNVEVQYFEWCFDFSSARNFSLNVVDSNWYFVIDADEEVVDGWHFFDVLRNTVPDFVGLVNILNMTSSDTLMNGVTSNYVSRVLPCGIKYEGVVHEQPVHNLSVLKTPLVIKHSGYFDCVNSKKFQRNIKLLDAAILKDPIDIRLKFQLGMQYESIGDFKKALANYDIVLNVDDVYKFPIYPSLVSRMIFCLKSLHEFEKAIVLASNHMPNLEESPDFYFALGDLFLDYIAVNADMAETYLPMIESAWLKCLSIGDSASIEGSVIGRGSFLAAHNLSILYEFTGMKEKSDIYKQLSERKLKETLTGLNI